MLAKRVIPTILKRGAAQVKGERFDSWRSVGVAEQAARVHAARGVDEIVILDVSATPQKREPDYAAVRRLSLAAFTPLTVGGGINSVAAARALLAAGADKIAICTEVGAIGACARRFGSQAVVGVLDVGGGLPRTHCGREPVYGIAPPARAAFLQGHGAGEILLQSVDRDGTMQGYDLELIRQVCSAVTVPVIASGGCSGYPDMLAAFEAGASAVAAGALFLFTDATPRGAVEYLHQKGVEVRV